MHHILTHEPFQSEHSVCKSRIVFRKVAVIINVYFSPHCRSILNSRLNWLTHFTQPHPSKLHQTSSVVLRGPCRLRWLGGRRLLSAGFGRLLLSDICGCGVSRIASAAVCWEAIACSLPKLLMKLVVSKPLGLHYTEEVLTHLCLASHFWDLGKQCKPRSNAAERGV